MLNFILVPTSDAFFKRFAIAIGLELKDLLLPSLHNRSKVILENNKFTDALLDTKFYFMHLKLQSIATDHAIWLSGLFFFADILVTTWKCRHVRKRFKKTKNIGSTYSRGLMRGAVARWRGNDIGADFGMSTEGFRLLDNGASEAWLLETAFCSM